MNLGKNLKSNSTYKICSRCVMDTSDPEIHFNNFGICNNCEKFLSNLTLRKYVEKKSEALWSNYAEVIKAHGKGKAYDCIAGVSGGVDSSYSVYLCKKYGLRTLLVHMDNGWDTEIAVSNVKNLAQKLDFDYTSYVLNWEEFRLIQLAFLKAFTVDLEMPTDIGIVASIYEIARKNNIKYIISGGNLSSEGMLPITWGYHRYKDMRLYKYIVKKYSSTKIKDTPTIGLVKESYYRFIHKIKTLYILNYHNYNKDSAKLLLMKECGWKDYGGKHHESKITSFWQGYVMYEKFGKDYRRPTFSAQICGGQISREDALSQLAIVPFNLEKIQEEKKYISKKFGITIEDLERLLNSHPKCYKDFPNNKELIDFCYKLYEKYFNSRRV